MLKYYSLQYRHGRISFIDHIRLQLFLRHGANPKNTMRPASDAACDDGPGTDPHPIFQYDRRRKKIKTRFTVIVTPRQEQAALRKRNVTADDHLRQIVDTYLLPDPGMLPHRQLPGELDIDRRLDDHSLRDPRTEPA